MSPVDLGPEDRPLVEEILATAWEGDTVEDIYMRNIAGTLEAWHVPGGLVLTEVLGHKAGRELFVYGIAGRGILAQGETIVAGLRQLAAERRCRWIGAEGIPKGWLRAATRLGFSPVSTRFLMES